MAPGHQNPQQGSFTRGGQRLDVPNTIPLSGLGLKTIFECDLTIGFTNEWRNLPG